MITRCYLCGIIRALHPEAEFILSLAEGLVQTAVFPGFALGSTSSPQVLRLE